MRSKLAMKVCAMAAILLCCAAVFDAQEREGPRFLADDPMRRDDDRAVDAAGARRDTLGGYADFVLNTFFSPGDARPIRALNVNTADEVPDSSWFTNRIGSRPMSLEEIVRGPDLVDRLEVQAWTIVAGKNTGRQAGFRAVNTADPNGSMYQIEFDPAGNPEMATGAEVIGTAIYHAIGFNVVDTYLVDVDPARLTIAPSATIEIAGEKRRFTPRDLEQVLRRAARRPNGTYRASASRWVEGRNLGPFRYYGTRPDDPNDIHPHEHRRELRANRVFTAWLNHDDSRAVNSLDVLVGPAGNQYVKHYMFDFGSILGSGTNEQDHPWVGHEYVVQPRPALMTLATFGVWRRPFIAVEAPSSMPAAGNFTADRFDPVTWRPHYPNRAFANMQRDDGFWAARIVAAFTPEAIGAVVRKAQFSDPAVVDHVTGTLLKRRELILRAWLTGQNPIVGPRIEHGDLVFDNAAVQAQVAAAPEAHEVSWFRYDNETGRQRYISASRIGPLGAAPLPLAALEDAEYIGVDIRALHAQHHSWQRPVRAYFRRAGATWALVGVDREPATADVRAVDR